METLQTVPVAISVLFHPACYFCIPLVLEKTQKYLSKHDFSVSLLSKHESIVSIPRFQRQSDSALVNFKKFTDFSAILPRTVLTTLSSSYDLFSASRLIRHRFSRTFSTFRWSSSRIESTPQIDSTRLDSN